MTGAHSVLLCLALISHCATPHSEDDHDGESQAASKTLPHGQHQRKQHQKQTTPPSPAILAMFREAHSVHPKKQPSHGNRGSSAFRTRPRETVDAASTASHLFLKYFREDYDAILQKSPKVPGLNGGEGQHDLDGWSLRG